MTTVHYVVEPHVLNKGMVEIEIILHAFEGFLHVLLVGVRGHAIAYFAGFYTYCSLSYIHLVYFEDKYM